MRREEGSKMGSLVNIRVGEGSAEMAEEKERVLLGRRGQLRSVIVALSGGTDSAYLAWAAHRALGEKALSVTALSESYSAYDREQVEIFLKRTGATTARTNSFRCSMGWRRNAGLRRWLTE